jgi:two-component system chemotaxis sensor kinase CheA
MSTQDEEFIKRLQATFQIEAEEHLQTISSMLLELEKSASPAQRQGTIETIYREAHSLKGAARAVDMSDIESVCQAIESVFSLWKREQINPPSEAFDMLHHTVDELRLFLSPGISGISSRRDDLIQRLIRLQSPSSPAAHRAPPPASAAPEPVVVPPAAESERTLATDTVRIDTGKLDRLLLQVEDMLTFKAQAAQRARELRELTSAVEQWWKTWAGISAETRLFRQANAGEIAASTSARVGEFLEWNCDFIRSMEKRLVSLAAFAQQDHYSIDKRINDLLEDSKKLLMLPFSTLAGIFPKIVRDLSRDQGKEVDFVLHGGDVEIDKRILEEIKDALIHLLRNSVDHGIETAGERARCNKPPRALITMNVSQVNGHKVEIVVSDDGAGVDIQRVKESAVKRGILSPANADAMSDAEAMNLIFHSEISTSPIVTAVSGRGLGMTIARAKVEKLDGRVAVESKRHAGTTVRLLLPLTMATFRGILFSAGDGIFVVPTSNVERIVQVKPSDIKTVENRETIQVDGRALSLARMSAVLEIPAKTARSNGRDMIPVAIFSAAGQRLGFAVEEILHEEEVLVKPLRKPLVRVRNIAGVTILGSGKPVPVLNVADLMKSALTKGIPAAISAPTAEPQAPSRKVLVVEDSITSRMLLKGILESAGYQVKVCVDGMDAFTALREDQYDLVVSDVEMPRLNGFDLTMRIRADKRLAELPVILVTALESRTERERGIDAGANAYIVKSSFDQSNLLEVVRRLI